MRQAQRTLYGNDIPDRVERALDELMKAFSQAQNAKTKEERTLAKANLARVREEYRRVVDETMKTEVLAIA